MLYFRSEISVYLCSTNSRIELGDLFSAIFGWCSIQTGFLFAVYGYVAGSSGGFIGAIKQTGAMKKMSTLLWQTIFVGFVLTLSSMALVVFPLRPYGFELVLLIFWFSLFVLAFLLFCIVAYRFGVIINVPDQPTRKGAG